MMEGDKDGDNSKRLARFLLRLVRFAQVSGGLNGWRWRKVFHVWAMHSVTISWPLRGTSLMAGKVSTRPEDNPQ